MRKFRVVYMRGGTSKGCMFHREDLPEDQSEWDSIFLQTMGSPDPKQIDGMGGTVSSNNKIVVVWKSQESGADIEYLVGQVIPGKNRVDYKSNCGNMTAAVGPFAVEEGMVNISEPVTTVHLLNRNTDKYIDVDVPIDPDTHSFAQEGSCSIAGVDGTAAQITVKFLNPAGAKTGKLFPTGKVSEMLYIPDFGPIEATIIDVSNPLVMVRAEDIHMTAAELPEEINSKAAIMDLLEKIRGTACVKMGFARDLREAEEISPAVPKVAFISQPKSYTDMEGKNIDAGNMDILARVISVFRCHKACPLTAAGAISTSYCIEGTIVQKLASGTGSTLSERDDLKKSPKVRFASQTGSAGIRIGHPSGVMTIRPDLEETEEGVEVHSVSVPRTARRIIDGTLYIRR